MDKYSDIIDSSEVVERIEELRQLLAEAHPIHKMYAEINIGIRDRGERWGKCANCGDVYQMTEAWSGGTVCSDDCFSDFAASLGGF